MLTVLCIALSAVGGDIRPAAPPAPTQAPPPPAVVGIDIDPALDVNGDGYVSDREEQGYGKLDTLPEGTVPAKLVYV